MWQEKRPEALRELPLRVLLHRAWLERKKNFDNLVEFPKQIPFWLNRICLDILPQWLVVVKDAKGDSTMQCAQSCLKGTDTSPILFEPNEMESFREKLSRGQCSGLIAWQAEPGRELFKVLDGRQVSQYQLSIIGSTYPDRIDLLFSNAERSHLSIIVSVKRFVDGSGKLIREELDKLYGNLKKYHGSGVTVSLLMLVSGEFEQDFAVLTRLSELQLPALTILYRVSIGQTNTLQATEQCGRLVAISRLLNPEANLGFACISVCPSQASLLEQYALNAGFNVISCPSQETVSLAKDIGLEIKFVDRCCLVRSSSSLGDGSVPAH